MIERRVIRLLTVFSPMYYYLDGPEQRGIVYESALQFEKGLNKALKRRRLQVRVVIIPIPRDDLIPALVEGRGDIAAANLTITPERLEQIDFSEPILREVSEIIVTGPAADDVATLDDLAGREIHLRATSNCAAPERNRCGQSRRRATSATRDCWRWSTPGSSR
jgi:ABC-type amino acid transport substrate-binding protein